jgi:hypothetical protein
MKENICIKIDEKKFHNTYGNQCWLVIYKLKVSWLVDPDVIGPYITKSAALA